MALLLLLSLSCKGDSAVASYAASIPGTPNSNSTLFSRDDLINKCQGRSVWDIVWSCIATTFAVTWVSVHPNVPWLEEKSSSLLKRRIFLMLLSLLAPEVMIVWAFKQWRSAVMIRESINKALPDGFKSRPWTTTHAHFLQMGGFKLRTVDINDNLFFNSYYGHHYTIRGIDVWEGVLHDYFFKTLLRKGKIDFPEISTEDVMDRSKGDSFSKGVALLQVSWLIVQLIARAEQNLAITGLELTTAALAGLNSAMYLFWWSKPVDVRYPIVIQTKELQRLLLQNETKELRENTRSEGHELWVGEHDVGQSPEEWAFPVDENGKIVAEDDRLMSYLLTKVKISLARILMIFAVCLHWRQHICSFFSDVLSAYKYSNSNETFCATQLAKRTWSSCKLIASKLLYLPYLALFVPSERTLQPPHWVRLEEFSDAKAKMHSKPSLRLFFDENDMKWILSMMFYSEYTCTRSLLYLSAFTGAIFASVHCAAWNFDFPSHIEMVMWRGSALSIIGVCLCIVVGGPLYDYIIRKWRRSPKGSREEWLWKIVWKSLDIGPAMVYVLARLSLLVLSLASLRVVPVSSYETVNWTKYIPHI